METSRILARVYQTSSIIIVSVMLLICFFYRWNTEMTLVAAVTCFVISAPAVISLNAICWMLRRVQLSMAFAWILLLALVPLLVLAPAFLLVNALPGDAWFLVVMGMASAYAGILGQGTSIAELFKSLL